MPWVNFRDVLLQGAGVKSIQGHFSSSFYITMAMTCSLLLFNLIFLIKYEQLQL